MSSDSEKLGRPNRRQRQIISDSDSSDDSFAHSLRHAKCKRKRFRQRVISEGESTNDDSDVPSRPVQKKKNHKLTSDEEMSSDSSDNAGVEDFLDESTSSEWQSDWESMDEDNIDMAAASASKNSLKKSSNKEVPRTSYESEISDGESEKCPICLLSFQNQEVASPTSCDHCFCLDCLIEWSKNVNTCPVDRQMFNMINVRTKIGGKIIRHVPIETKVAVEETIQEDSTYCEICRQCTREDRMLLCDGCDLGYHLDCLNPPLEEVPPEEFWHCPECQNNQDDAESIEIDLEELPDIMVEARRLGVSYGRSTAALAAQNNLSHIHRSSRVPRTQQAERVRTNVRIRRRAAAAAMAAFDNRAPQPSTSSGFDSISENSRTRSPVPGPSSSSNSRRVAARKKRSSVLKRKPKRKKRRTATTRSRRRSAEFREVRISEINENGELEEIVTYIRASASATGYGGPVPAGRRRKKRKKLRRARTVASVAASLKTAKRRLATRLKIMSSSGMNSMNKNVQLVPTIKKESVPMSSSATLRMARHHAGIAQLSLFGSGLGLDYSPPGSEDEQEESTTTGGTGLLSRVRSAATSGIRRRLGLKAAIAQPNITHSTDSSIDILSSILSSQEIWHSNKSKITLKSDGSFEIEKPKKKPEANNNIDNSPIKIKPNNESPSKKEKPLDLTNINPNNLVQQAPMYNNSRGGGNRSGGNYRGGNYRDNNSRHSHGGNYNNNGGGGGGSHDSYSGGGGGGGGSGRHSFGGTSNHPQDYFPGGGNYSNYEHRNPPPPLLGMQSPFRSRNPQQNFRNRFPPPQFNQEDRPPPGRDLDQDSGRDQSRNQNRDFPFQDQFARPRMPGMPGVPPPPPPLALRMSAPRSNENKGPQDRETNAEDRSNLENEKYDSQQANQQESKDNKPDEDYDMYDDLEAPRKSDNRMANEDEDSSHSLLPPPEPPTDLFDFDESERGQDSDREDLVIDDTPREDAAVRSSNVQTSADKYDPFAADSDSDDSQHHHQSRFTAKSSSKESHPNIQPTPLRPPPGLSEFPGLKNDDNESIMGDGASIMGDNASIMGDNASVMGDNASIMGDDDYQSSKPNSDEKRGSSSRALEPPPHFGFSEMDSDMMSDDGKSKEEEKKNSSKPKISVPRIRLTAYDDDEDEDSESDCPNFSIYSSETINVARHTEQELSSQIEPLNQSVAPVESDKKKPDPLEPPSMPSIEKDEEQANESMEPLEPPPMPLGMLDDDMRSKAGSPESVAPLEPPPVPPMDDLESVADPLEPPPMPPMDDLESTPGSPVAPLEPPPMPPMDDLEGSMVDPLEPPPMPPMDDLEGSMVDPLEPPPMPPMEDLDEHPPLEPPPMPPLDSLDRPETPGPLEPPPMPPLGAMDISTSMTSMPPPRLTSMTSMPPPSMTSMPPPSMTMQPSHMINLQMPPPTMLPVQVSAPMTSMQPPLPLTAQAPPPPLEPPPLPPIDDLNLDESQNDRPLEPPPAPPSILGDDDDNSLPTTSEEEDEGEEDNEEDDTPVIGPKNRGRKKSISKKNDESIGDQDEDVIVGDVQACDLTESETSHYVDAVQKERQTLNKSSGKIQLDSRGKITFKIGNLSRLNKVNLYDELDETEISRMNLDLEKEREKEKELDKDKDRDRDRDKEKDREKDKERDKDRDREREKDKHKEREREKEKEKDSKRKDDKEKSKYDSKSKYSEKDSKSKSKYDDKKSSKSSKSKYEESSKSSKDSKSKHYTSKDSKHKKSHDKPLHPQSGWDIKPRGMTSSESSSDSQSSDSSSPTRKDSPIRLDSPILLDSPVRSPIRKSEVSKPVTKQINIDLDELQQTLDKKLVELEDLNKLHPDDTDIVSIPDETEFDQSKSKKSSETEDQLVKPVESVDNENEKNLTAKDVVVAAPSVIKLTEQENNLLDEIEKSCEVELNKEVTPTDEAEETKMDVVVEEVSADKESENAEQDDVEKIVDELIEKPITNDNVSVKSMELSDAEDKAIEDIEQEVEAEAEESGSEKKDEEEDVVITADINDKSEIIDLDSAEFVDKPVTFVGDLDNDGYQIESTPVSSRAEPEEITPQKRISEEPASEWEAEGAFTPCKDERVASKNLEMRVSLSGRTVSLIESDLEPITPTKDRISDGLDGIRTPAGYAGLGTEAISETDEAMNFEDELALLNMRSKDRDVEEGEIPDDRPRKQSAKAKDLDDEAKQRRSKRGKKEKANKDTNKENIASDNNLAAAWKKSSKIVAVKERQYREKRSKSKDPKLKKKKEVVKKKDKRKELPRYNVRKLVQEKPRARKDAYGRDIRESSRSRSLSLSRERSLSFIRRSRSYSPRGRRVSRSRSRSWSRTRRSRSYRSVSRRRSLSPRSRREKLRRRSLSRTRARTRSRSRSHSRRRSVTPRRRSRRSMSKKRRSRSRSRSRTRSRSHSHSRRKDKKKHVSRSRSRVRKRSRSKSQKKREKKHSKRKVSRSRSRSIDRHNWEHHQLALAEKVADANFQREASWAARWAPSWSRSRSRTPPIIHPENIARNWSPPTLSLLNSVNVPPKNLKVILTNKEAIKKKKKEKRKENRKLKEAEKKRKNKKGRSPPPSKEVFASGDNILVSVCFNKDNDVQPTGVPELPETIPLLPPVKRRRREPLQLDPPQLQAPPAKKAKKDKAKEKAVVPRAKSPMKPIKKKEKKKSKAAEIAASKKPMAVIDLDQSPFREQTPSPRDVIVLSDDDDKQQAANEELEEMGTPEQPQESHTPARLDAQFLQGPKTPPEPQVKFSIANKQSNLRPSLANPLLEEEELEEEMEMEMDDMAEMEELLDEQVEEDHELRAQEELESRTKVGPNTPPEPPTSPPTSPDAYDPFDPTKSRSPTPEPNSQEDNNADERLQTADGDSPSEPQESQADDKEDQEEQTDAPKSAPEKPKIISVVTIKRLSPISNTPPLTDQNEAKADASPGTNQTAVAATQQQQQQQQQQQPQQTQTAPQISTFPAINPVLATVAAAVQRSTIFSAASQLVGPRNLLQTNTLVQNSQMKQQQRPTLPNIFANSIPKPMPVRTLPAKLQAKNMSMLAHNGSDANIEMSNDNIDMSSPYSPGSSLSDGLFDPPSPAFNSSPNVALSTKIRKSQEKKDAFDALFDGSPIVHKSSMKARTKKSEKDKKRKGTHSKIGVRMDENQLQILDDLPSSAVEMQVKDKFLKKLNRQERVVEEVKLVLKPHYTKKHVTKEEYKDIMRKAVPKICHNKSGEINPKKIAALIEAYVKRVRAKKKFTVSTGATNSMNKKPAKTLWS